MMNIKVVYRSYIFIQFICFVLLSTTVQADAQQQTQGDEWIDAETGHKVIRLSRRPGENFNFYFHQNIFTKDGDKMLFLGMTDKGVSAFSVNMKTFEIEKISKDGVNISNEVTALCPVSREFFYLSGTTLYETHIDSLTTRIAAENLPDYYQGGRGLTYNSDETVLVGSYTKGEEKYRYIWSEISKPKFEETVFNAKLPNALYTIDISSGTVNEFYHINEWLGHVQFSPTDPTLLEFCHEGPEKKLQRMWLIRTNGTELKPLFKYTIQSIPHEHVTHEFWSPDGNTIWFDLEYPQLCLGNVDIATNETIKYPLPFKRALWHYNISPDGKRICGDGSHTIPEERWIYILTPVDGEMKIDRICDMRKHNYLRAPNTHFTPDGKWVVFDADFGGGSQVYAVEVEKSK